MKLFKLIIVSAALFGSALTLAFDYWINLSARQLQIQRGDRLPKPRGVTVEGRALPDGAAPCWLIRYASELCEYCKRDAKEYVQFEERAALAGCQSILIAPEPTVFPQGPSGRGDRINLALTTFDFAAAMPLRGTPTTLVLDRDAQVIWSKLGPVSPADIATATATLERQLHGR